MIAMNGLISALTVMLAITSMGALLRYNRKMKKKREDKIPFALYCAQMIFYVLCAAEGLCRVPDIIVNCYEFGLWWRLTLQFMYAPYLSKLQTLSIFVSHVP